MDQIIPIHHEVLRGIGTQGWWVDPFGNLGIKASY